MRITYYYLLIFYTKISLNLSAFLVVSPPSFAEEPQDTWFNVDKPTSNLNCVANNYPNPVNYQWMHDNKILSEFTNSTHINVDKYGPYTCLLSNSFGTVRSRTALVQKPVIKYQKMIDVHKNINNGGYLFLPSLEVFESIPPVEEVFWQKKESQEWKNVVQKDLYTKNGSLLIRKVSVEDNGSFRYIIKQKSGHSVVGYNITVNITGTVSNNLCENNSVALLEVPTHVTVYAGQDISIECIAFFYRCSNPPGFGWYHNYPSNKNYISHKRILNISNSTFSDSGNYSCEVRPPTNKYMPQTLVTVLVKPTLNISISETFYIKNGAPITLDKVTLVSSFFLKNFEWYFNGKSLSGNSKYNYTTDYKLIINQPSESDSGIYQVFYFFDGLELKHAFNAFFVKNESIMVTDLLSSTSMPVRYSTSSISTMAVTVSSFSFFSSFSLTYLSFYSKNLSISTEGVKVSSFLLASTFSSIYIPIHSKNLSISTESVKVSSFLLAFTFLSANMPLHSKTLYVSTETVKLSSLSFDSTLSSAYIPLHKSIFYSSHPSFLSSLLSSSFKSSCMNLSSAVSSQSGAATLPSLVPKKEQIKNDALTVGLSVGSAVLIIALLVSLVMRKRYFIKKGINKKRIIELAMCERKVLDSSTENKTNDYLLPMNNEYAVLEERKVLDSSTENKTNDYLLPMNNEYAVLEENSTIVKSEFQESICGQDEPNYHIIEVNNYSSIPSSDKHTEFKKKSNDNYCFEPDYKELEISCGGVTNDSNNYTAIYASVPDEVKNNSLLFCKNKINPTKNILMGMKSSPIFSRPLDLYTPLKNNHVSNKSTLPNRATDLYTALNKKDRQSPQSYAKLNFDSSTEEHAKNSQK